MKVKDRRLDSFKYAELKNNIYKIYLSDIENPEGNKIEKLFSSIERFNCESLNEIVGDTIEFPYDKELFDFYKRNSSMKVNDFIMTASNIFGIDTELVASKIREYLAYDFNKLLSDGLINSDYVNQISNLYLKQNKEKSK